jgi:hypothetical protein
MTGACGFMKRKTAAPTASINNQFVGASGSTTAAATARYRVNTTGVVEGKEGSAAYTTLETWLLSGTAAGHSVRFTNTNGVAPTGTLGVFTAITAAQEITYARGGLGVSQSINTVEIRNDSTLQIVSATITLESERI